MKIHKTLSQVINELAERGYTFNFNLKNDCLHCVENAINVFPDEFEIDEVHRFYEMSDVGDESVLYAISSDKYGLKGILVNAFGIYADHASADLISKLEMSEKN